MTKPYVRPVPATWWLQRGSYVLFMLRELSSVFVALYVLELLCLVLRVREGPAAVAQFFGALRAPVWILFHAVALAFALLHSITWFNLTPKVMVVRRGEEKVPGALIAAANYMAWAVVSGLLWWIVA